MTAQTPQPFEEQVRQILIDKDTFDLSISVTRIALIAAHRAEMRALLNRVEGKKQNATIYDAGKNNEPRETLAVTLADIRALKAELNDTKEENV